MPDQEKSGRSSAQPDTRLANERTYLAWWRTGLTSLAVGIGAGRIIPAVTDEAQWPYTIIGIGFALLGIGLIGYATIRHRQVERALARGEFVSPGDRAVIAFTGAGVVLGLIVLAVLIGKS